MWPRELRVWPKFRKILSRLLEGWISGLEQTCLDIVWRRGWDSLQVGSLRLYLLKPAVGGYFPNFWTDVKKAACWEPEVAKWPNICSRDGCSPSLLFTYYCVQSPWMGFRFSDFFPHLCPHTYSLTLTHTIKYLNISRPHKQRVWMDAKVVVRNVEELSVRS